MAINFYKTGESIMQLAKLGAEKFTVKYDKGGIQRLAESDLKLPNLMEDVFTGCSHPVLEISAKPSAKHNVVNMLTKDSNEVITDTPLLFSKDLNVLDMLPEVVGKSKKISLGKEDAKKIIMEDETLKQYFMRPLLGAKKPNIEIASKNGDKYNITVLTLKDGDEVVARGAYSKSTGNGAKERKFHFYDGISVNSGYKFWKNCGSSSLSLLPKSFAEKVEVLCDKLLMPREKLLVFSKYALNGEKRKSEQQLADMMGLTKQRAHDIIERGLDKIKEYKLTPQMVDTYKKYAKVPLSYLSENYRVHVKNTYLKDLLSHDSAKRVKAECELQDLIRINEEYSDKRIYDVIHDIPKPQKIEEPVMTDITDVWVTEA